MIALLAVTLVSITTAVVMGVFAWRLARDERRRSEARVQGLAAEIRQIGRDEVAAPVAVSSLFAAETSAQRSAPLRALGIGVLVVGAALASIVAMAGRSHDQSSAHTAPLTSAPPLTPEPAPLELTSLEHETGRAGLVVRGTVRHQGTSAPNAPLVAAVLALNRDGMVVGSGQAPLEIASTSASGDVESSFVVRIAGVDGIERYRVSFRGGDGTIEHVDRRTRPVTAQLP